MAQKAPPPKESDFAREGTIAHSLADVEARREFKLPGHETYEADLEKVYGELLEHLGGDLEAAEREYDAMHDYVAWYLDVLAEAKGDTGALLLEQRLATGIKGCWGTSDAVIIRGDTIHVIDLKYGRGVEVSPVENPQFMLYALGALRAYRDMLEETRRVKMTVFQPRINNIDTWEITVKDLEAWRDKVAHPAARKALTGENTEFAPSESACKFCPAAGICKPRAESITAVAFDADPNIISLEDRAGYLARLGEIKSWVKHMEETSLELAYERGETIPGWKVVRSSSRRVIADVDAASERLQAAGYDESQFITRKMAGVTDLDRLVGKNTLPEVLGDALQLTEGRPSLVPESDRRKAISKKQEVEELFTDET
jgi:conserved phage-associated protein